MTAWNGWRGDGRREFRSSAALARMASLGLDEFRREFAKGRLNERDYVARFDGCSEGRCIFAGEKRSCDRWMDQGDHGRVKRRALEKRTFLNRLALVTLGARTHWMRKDGWALLLKRDLEDRWVVTKEINDAFVV